MLPPGGCVRWIWATKSQRGASPASYCPADVTPPARAMSFDEAVARSINSMTVRHALLLPPLLSRWRPDLLHEIAAEVPSCERAALDSPADRALAGGLLAQLGETVAPDQVAPELSYSAAGIALFRYLRARRELAGLPAERLPDDPTSLLGNSSRATAEQIGGYLHRKLLAADGSCTLSDTGALLALHRRAGTLRWLAWRWPRLVFAGKTGSSPHDDSALAGIAVCLDAAQQMRRLAESLLQLARFDAGQEPMRRSIVDLAENARVCVGRIGPLAKERGIKINCDLGPAKTFGDTDRLDQLITNLLTNAIHYNKPGGQICVNTCAVNDAAVLTIADTGKGIAPEDLPHIFERFYRADKSRSRADGHFGLGLAICKAIIDADGGSIDVSSEFGVGTTFTVRLPGNPT